MPPPPILPTSYRTALLVRTGFADAAAWEALLAAARTPSPEGFLAGVEVVDEPAHAGLEPARLRALLPDPYPGPFFLFVADHRALGAAGHPVLVVPVPYPAEIADLDLVPRPEFRVVVRELWSVENNLSIANMDWVEFVRAADPDGVFRGF